MSVTHVESAPQKGSILMGLAGKSASRYYLHSALAAGLGLPLMICSCLVTRIASALVRSSTGRSASAFGGRHFFSFGSFPNNEAEL